ncbi:MAG TPA: hypothetical protein VF306_00160 [Pirellulales bacterium]
MAFRVLRIDVAPPLAERHGGRSLQEYHEVRGADAFLHRGETPVNNLP